MMRWFAFALIVSLTVLTRASAGNSTYLNGSGSALQTPGHPITYTYWTNLDPKKPIRVDVYRIPAERAVASLRRERSLWPGNTNAFTRVASIASISRDVAVPAQPPGYYLLVAHAAEQSFAALVDVTSFGLMGIDVQGRHLVVPIDLATFNYEPSVTLSAIDDRGTRALRLDRSGIADVGKTNARTKPIVVASGADGSVTTDRVGGYYEPYGASDGSAELGYVQTDRPIYRAGQTIDVRAILRSGSIGAYVVPHGRRHLRVNAPDGSVVAERDLDLTPFGTVHASVPLAQDAQLGTYQLRIGDLTRTVTVAAYKKPEYLLTLAPERKAYVGGDRARFTLDARYFFGRPAAGMHLHYVAFRTVRQPWWYDPYEFAGVMRRWYAQEQIGEGDFETGADGKHAVAIDTTKTDVENDVTLRVDGRDASGRTVETESSILVTPASFSLRIEPDEWYARAGRPASIRIHARTYEDGPRASARVHVSIVGTRYDEKQGKDVQRSSATVDVTTDARGDAAFSWTPREGGSYTFKATSHDERGFVASSQLYLWALGANENEWFAPIERPQLIAQKTTFAPGEPVRMLVVLPKANRDVVIATTTDRLVDARVVHVAGMTQTVTIPVPRAASHLAVTAMLPNENGVENANLSITIAPPPNALHVTLTPSKPRFGPGERARFDVRATDERGRPVRSELAVGVVDEALYAVQEDDKTNPFDVFYDRVGYAYGSAPWFRPNFLAKASGSADVYAVPRMSSESGVPNQAYAAIASMSKIPVRSNFQDTAYWAPSVVTDANGRASIAFAWPDNLTTWRATGVAVTASTKIGRATGAALVTKNFLVRLETPRFLRAGDRSSIVGIAHGTARAKDVRMQLDAGALAAAPFDALLHLGANDDASTSWPVSVPGVGGAMLALRGTDGSKSDGTQQFLPLLGATALEHDRDAGTLPERSSLALRLPPGNLAGDLHLTLAPSIVAQLVQSVRLFDVYPYYCTEQTTSAALPAAMLLRLSREYGITLPADLKPREIIGNASERLSELHHEDGGWGWWEHDESQQFMTAYAVYGLAEMRDALGKLPNEYLLESGASALRAQLTDVRGADDWNARAFALMALARAGATATDRAQLAQAFDHLRDMDAYGYAVLGLAAHEMHDDTDARVALRELDRSVTVDGDSAFWHRDAWTWAWSSDPIETTAYALRLYAQLEPSSPRIAQVVNFLRSQRRGDWWYTTKDSAAAAVAIAEALRPQPAEMHPDETIRVKAGSRVVRVLHVTQPILDAADAQVVVPASALQHGETISFERSGRGALYWSSDWERYLDANATRTFDANKAVLDRLFAKPAELSISRTYHAPHPGPWKVGDEIDVELTVSARDSAEYVAIEDPFPAGAEHQPLQGQASDEAWSGFQFLDDRATFFVDFLGGYPRQLHYTLRVTTPGTYTAPPPDAYAMYGPPVSALGSPERIEVQP